MIWWDPVQKQEFFYLGSRGSEKHVLFGAQKITFHLGWDTPPPPHLHIKSSLYVWRRGHKSSSYGIQLSQFVHKFLRFGLIEISLFWVLPLSPGGFLGMWGWEASIDMCTHTHAQNTKINMLGNSKWLPPWRRPCLSCLTCMHVCMYVCMCMHVCACMHMRTCVGCAPPPTTHPLGGYSPNQ